MDTLVELQFADDVDLDLTTEVVQRWVTHVFDVVDWQGAREVCIRIVDRQESQDLNNTYRSKNAATNVLSFGNSEIDAVPADAQESLGDLAICAAVVEDEALQQGKDLLAHWTHLVIHGVLHLMGYDHESSADASKMETLEIQLLADLGIGNPYAES